MKKIMVIKDEQAIDEWNRTIAQFIDVDNKIYKAEFVKVPESWEELKELCKGLNKIRIANIEGTESIVLNDNLICDKYGNVFADFSEHTYCLAQNRTIPKVWSFIKSLIGEE